MVLCLLYMGVYVLVTKSSDGVVLLVKKKELLKVLQWVLSINGKTEYLVCN